MRRTAELVRVVQVVLVVLCPLGATVAGCPYSFAATPRVYGSKQRYDLPKSGVDPTYAEPHHDPSNDP